MTISLKRSSLHYTKGKFDGIFNKRRKRTNLGGIHLVDGDDELPDTEGEGKESVLSGLAILGDTGLELTGTAGNDEDSAVSLGGTSDHVLDEVTMSWGIDDLHNKKMRSLKRRRALSTYSNVVLGRLEFPEGDIDGDTTLTLSLEFVENPGWRDWSARSIPAMKKERDAPYLNEPLPSSAASFSNFSIVRLSIPPHL